MRDGGGAQAGAPKEVVCTGAHVWHCKGIYRVSVDLPKERKARLAAEAKRRGISESELVRIALAKELPGKLSGAGVITEPPPPGVSGRNLHEHMDGFGSD
jgi:hypothetical protein